MFAPRHRPEGADQRRMLRSLAALTRSVVSPEVAGPPAVAPSIRGTHGPRIHGQHSIRVSGQDGGAVQGRCVEEADLRTPFHCGEFLGL